MKKYLIVKASLFTLILVFMAVGTIAIAKAVMNRADEVPKHTQLTTKQVWYSLSLLPNETGNQISHYRIDAVMDEPPQVDEDSETCAQENPSGKFCSIQLEFPDTEDEEDALTLDVPSAITALGATQTGQARDPSTP